MGDYRFVHSGNYVKIILHDIPEKPGVAAKILNIIAKENINILTIKHTVHSKEKGDFAFTVKKENGDLAMDLMKKNLKEIGAKGLSIRRDLALVFIWGEEIKNLGEFASDILRAFSQYNVEFDSLSLAVEGITCILLDSQFNAAMHAFNKMFVDEPIISPI